MLSLFGKVNSELIKAFEQCYLNGPWWGRARGEMGLRSKPLEQVGMYPCSLKPRLKYELSWLRWFKAVFSWPSLPTLYSGVEDIPGGAGRGRGATFRYCICQRAGITGPHHSEGWGTMGLVSGSLMALVATHLYLRHPVLCRVPLCYVCDTICPPVAAPEKT